MITETEIMQKYVGVPFAHRGRDLIGGLDCWGLIIEIYADLGFRLFDIDEPYDENWHFNGKNYFLENYWRDWKSVETPGQFDGILFRVGMGEVNHAGVYLSDGKFMHATKQGVLVSRLEKWRVYLDGFFHLKARDQAREFAHVG